MTGEHRGSTRLLQTKHGIRRAKSQKHGLASYRNGIKHGSRQPKYPRARNTKREPPLKTKPLHRLEPSRLPPPTLILPLYAAAAAAAAGLRRSLSRCYRSLPPAEMDDSCAVCADALEWVAYGPCGHREVCSNCVVRLRFVLEDPLCCICKTDCPSVFVTKVRRYGPASIRFVI